ncbi:hypothetical protein D9758_012454 [Tetrapyrgos nigripes]|uniref:Uncharacterized protein n=1 Tax=Tetrapyrgos nigripes TaxID=182062 RepID=A0A8H5CZE7_9AGAR|nr:hypothetical protein D9758_012454 [Tetrapyrgos nigripes]
MADNISTFDNDMEFIFSDAEKSVNRLNSLVSESLRMCLFKERILHYTKIALDICEFELPISADNKKSSIHGWNHSQLARLLCIPTKLKDFDEDPALLSKVQENTIKISGNHFPPCFYWDLGEEALKGPGFVFDHLLTGWLIVIMIMFRAEANKVGKGLSHGATTVTYQGIAYATLMVRHGLAATNSWHHEEGGVIKQSAFDAIIALFEDPRLMSPDWIETTLGTWIDSDDDLDSSINAVAEYVLQEQIKKAFAAVTLIAAKAGSLNPSPEGVSVLAAVAQAESSRGLSLSLPTTGSSALTAQSTASSSTHGHGK